MEFFNTVYAIFWILIIFTFCFITVFGIRSLLDFLGIKQNKKKRRKKQKRKKYYGKTLTINPDEIGRIYVKREE